MLPCPKRAIGDQTVTAALTLAHGQISPAWALGGKGDRDVTGVRSFRAGSSAYARIVEDQHTICWNIENVRRPSRNEAMPVKLINFFFRSLLMSERNKGLSSP